MIDDGALQGIGEIYGFHNWPPLPTGTAACPDAAVMVANAQFFVKITGKGGHASQPEACADPVLAAASMICDVQDIVAREIAPQRSAVVGVSMVNAGTATNCIPDTASFAGTLRSDTAEGIDTLFQSLERRVMGLAAAHGVEAQCRLDKQYPATVNHPEQAEAMRRLIADELGEGCFRHQGIPIMGAEDFSYYLQKIPGAYFLLGSGAGDAIEPCHSPRFDFADDLIPLTARLWCRLAGIPEDVL